VNNIGTCSVVISQPMYFPWPGFFELMAMADVFVWYDDAQFSRRSFTNRVKVSIEEDQRWMSIPLSDKGTATDIADLSPAPNGRWPARHRRLLQQSIGSAPHRDLALSLFDLAVARSPLVECLIASVEEPADLLGILPPKILRSSRMGIGGRSWPRVLELTKAVGGTRYVTAHGAAHYLDHEAFEKEGVSVEYMDYSLTPWPRPPAGYTPFVTALDLIAWTGDAAREYLHPRSVPWRTFLAES